LAASIAFWNRYIDNLISDKKEFEKEISIANNAKGKIYLN